jgi:beta-phosphoglucomutase
MKRGFPNKVKAVIFDMDGVITNTMPYHYEAWRMALAEAGVKVNCYDIYLREGQDGITSVREILAKYRVPFTVRSARQLLARKETLFKGMVRVRFIKGSRPFLRRLLRTGVQLALVTGTSRHEMERILPRPLRELFSVTVTGDEVARGKPFPDPFRKALRGLRLTPGEAVVIENAPFGIESAVSAGLFCIALTTSLPRAHLRRAHAIVRDFGELQKYLNKQALRSIIHSYGR